MSNIASVEGTLQALRYHKIDKSFIPDENVFDFIIETLEEYQQLKEKATAKKAIETERNNLTVWDCPQCGNELYSGQKFCDECGKAITDEFE